MDAIKTLLKQPFSVIAFVLGVVLVVFPYLQIDKDNHFTTHNRTSVVPVVVGIALLGFGTLAFGITLWMKCETDKDTGAGLDFTRVKEDNGDMWTTVSGCQIHVIDGLLEDFQSESGGVVVLPCNEYFDDQRTGDTKNELGAYVNRTFDGQVEGVYFDC
jgi:hypothetical protein